MCKNQLKTAMARPYFEIVDTPGRGRGIVACRPLRRGRLVMRVTGELIDDPSYTSRYCIDLGNGRSLEPTSPGRFVNHSCDPNCQLVDAGGDRIELRSLRSIVAGEELTIDYQWEAEAEPKLCHCGSENCRRYIVDESELPKLLASLRQRAATAS
jgi:hypothetical protein